MASRRLERLGEQLKREISGILRTDVRDPRVGTPTVTGVEVTPDLWLARVHVQLTGSDEERAAALEGLEAAAPFVRRQLGQELSVRRVPEIRFVEDRTLEQARRIEDILREVGPVDGPGDSGDGGDADE
ncbi:MAG: 30S ribosome-binding factor RbfA [Gemmatimonadetes bacterium]|nr:30S ribosome-binding factor RbfA [Gemmatimonadota bacterium]